MPSASSESAVLDLTKPLSVTYCIPMWLRDEQIRVNMRQVSARIEPHEGLRAERIAVVGYGPSLNDTWEQIKGYDYIITCSGAHRFLIDRGIIPTWHVDVDPRLHKLAILGAPHPEVNYLPASTCHPDYVRALVDGGFKVRLWHIFENKQESLRVLPHGEWALFGGCDAGLRAMVVARFFGFTEQDIFGMDQSEGPSGKHAAAHPNQPKGHQVAVVDGVEYRTTVAMAECARQIPHELDQLPDVHATFHGEGLAQAIVRSYVPTAAPKGSPSVALVKPELISADYRALNAQLHRQNLAYGVGGAKHSETVLKLVDNLKSRSVLDYGCGKGYLAKALPFPIWEYDPAIPEKAESPRPADLVVCTDVLEHIEPDKLAMVLGDLARCVLKVGYFVIHTGPAQKTLPDGRNTHLIQHGEKWWRAKLKPFFAIGDVQTVGQTLHVVVGPHPSRQPKTIMINDHGDHIATKTPAHV